MTLDIIWWICWAAWGCDTKDMWDKFQFNAFVVSMKMWEVLGIEIEGNKLEKKRCSNIKLRRGPTFHSQNYNSKAFLSIYSLAKWLVLSFSNSRYSFAALQKFLELMDCSALYFSTSEKLIFEPRHIKYLKGLSSYKFTLFEATNSLLIKCKRDTMMLVLGADFSLTHQLGQPNGFISHWWVWMICLKIFDMTLVTWFSFMQAFIGGGTYY